MPEHQDRQAKPAREQMLALLRTMMLIRHCEGQLVRAYLRGEMPGGCAQALVEHSALNARLEGEGIIQFSSVNVAIAVDTDRRLLVPVLRDVQSKMLGQIAHESRALIENVRRNTIGHEDLQGATFAITNLGMYGIDTSTSIIDLPQCAVLGMGRIAPKPVVVDAAGEQVAIRQMMLLSLTFDHRLAGGAPAAHFLGTVREYVEEPGLWLVR